MPHPGPTPPNGGQNQTLLELIFALKGLAQTVEFYHEDLSRRLDEEAKDRQRELERLRTSLGELSQSVRVLPITFSDRVERLLQKLEQNLDREVEGTFGKVQELINDVKVKLSTFEKSSERVERAISDGGGEIHEDITGRIELTNRGMVRMAFQGSWLKKIWIVIVLLAAGGGAYGLVDVLKKFFAE